MSLKERKMMLDQELIGALFTLFVLLALGDML
jgi:hypothetical protein